MTYFSDLTTYTYGPAGTSEPGGSDPSVQNIGWLSIGMSFPTAPPDPRFVERLWRFCRISINEARGVHVCEFCNTLTSNTVRNNEEELLLGAAEIRVVGVRGRLYAAPNLVFHYVVTHNYSPPEEFVHAVVTGPAPPEVDYFTILGERGLTWSDTEGPAKSKPFRFVKTAAGVIKVDVE